MLGLLVILVVSWLLLYFIEKKHIEVLGIIPYPKRVIQFLIGVLVMSLINLSMIYIETLILSIQWESKPVNFRLIYDAFVYHLRSALTEDLVFRGAILFILISKLGSKKGIWISAIVFGVYHIFSYGMVGERIVPIIYVILVTGITGFVWAYTFHKTRSIYLGLGLHFGYNMIMTCFFESQPFGELLFTELSRVKLTGWNELYYALFRGFYPTILTLLILIILFKSKLKIFKSNLGQSRDESIT